MMQSLPDGYVRGVMSSGGKVTMHVITDLYGEATHITVPLDDAQVDKLIYSLRSAAASVSEHKAMDDRYLKSM